MQLRNIERDTLRKILAGIILTSLGIHLFSLYLGYTLIGESRWKHPPFHSAIEMAGAVIAFVVAFLLISLDRRDAGTSYNIRIAAALVGMGLLDAFHAMVFVGEKFVWLHSLSAFVGGLLFSLIWLPDHWFDDLDRAWPLLIGILVTIIGFLSTQSPGYLPRMVDQSGFTVPSKFLNVGGGILFLTASLKFMVTFRQDGKNDDLLFSVHCLLFGAAGLLFEKSILWNVTWWGWHFLRIMAYGAALVFAVDTTLRDQRNLRKHRADLEERVKNRTRELEKAVEEKQIFLEETHHRVKNNMQIISSILSLQKKQVDDEQINKKFQEALNRINSMAIVHELLYESGDLAHLNFENYTEKLIDKLEDTIQSWETEVAVKTNIQKAELDVDRAIRCGLILNELITNCAQHAFKNQSEGTVKLCFKELDNKFELRTEDNGTGVNSQDISELSSVGLSMVKTLVNVDLNGDIKINSDQGTTVIIRFPKHN